MLALRFSCSIHLHLNLVSGQNSGNQEILSSDIDVPRKETQGCGAGQKLWYTPAERPAIQLFQLWKPARLNNSLEVSLPVGTEKKLWNLTKALHFSFMVFHEFSISYIEATAVNLSHRLQLFINTCVKFQVLSSC